MIEAVARVAARWREPDHPARAGAVARTLEAPNTFTAEAVAFAVNQQMHALTPEALAAWVGGRQAAAPVTVGVLNAGNVPLVGLQDLLAVLLTGHRYLGVVSSKSPHLLPAFVDALRAELPSLPAAFATFEALLERAGAVIATGTDETRDAVAAACAERGIPPERRLLRGHRYAVAVIDGRERRQERENLAEDILLHEGYGCRNVALLWAPRGLDADPYFEAMAVFRSVFPPHPSTPAGLKMQQAMLAAFDVPHAYGEGLEFLVSRGAPEVQRPGHLRWVEYDDLAAVGAWLEAHRGELQLVVARPRLAERLPAGLPVAPPGEAQRPPLDWCPDGQDPVAFLTGPAFGG